jgi:TonB family protein
MSIRGIVVAVIAVVVLLQAAPGAAQDAISQAKTLYASADYEQALKQLEGAPEDRETHYYRALCLIALGRTAAADQEIAAVVTLDPMFTPGTDEVSPRVIATFGETRRRLLPRVARSTFNNAKRLFQAGDKENARLQFEQTLRMLDDSLLDEGSDLADLKLVAAGFVDLVRADTPRPTEAPPVQPVASPAAAAPPTAVAASNGAVTSIATLPITLEQQLPPWRPDAQSARRAFVGAVRVEIDETGHVTAAKIEQSVHITYDRLLLTAANKWLYKPATLNGVPVPSEKTVEIQLRPPGLQ